VELAEQYWQVYREVTLSEPDYLRSRSPEGVQNAGTEADRPVCSRPLAPMEINEVRQQQDKQLSSIGKTKEVGLS
jgi:hypothetical protein